jgi:aarF domain-containing kinase
MVFDLLTGLGDLANRWPRHVQKAVEASLQDGPPDKQDGSYLTLASQPAAASMQDVPADVNLRKEPSVAAEAVINFRGVAVPIKPSPPGAEDCCMSGCAVCVYDLYADDLRDYRESLTVAREKILNLDPPLKDSEWDTSILGPRPSRESASDTRTAEERVQQEVDDLIGQLDPSMKAFLQLERSLKQKKQKGLAPS